MAVGGRQKGEDGNGNNKEECRQLKSEADAACRCVGWLYDVLVKFAKSHTLGGL